MLKDDFPAENVSREPEGAGVSSRGSLPDGGDVAAWISASSLTLFQEVCDASFAAAEDSLRAARVNSGAAANQFMQVKVMAFKAVYDLGILMGRNPAEEERVGRALRICHGVAHLARRHGDTEAVKKYQDYARELEGKISIDSQDLSPLIA
ncbi:MAG: hypothetical protein H6857_04665 [Rhodospirillales bacterium]|nr:hypothetical protein [Rhodospirillales bacterium]MCB9973672.1 hypothetical protein [Rhodospirillales bacterium]MCB9980631.1 hypothetical protein [Rhodospirillales bacterium]